MIHCTTPPSKGRVTYTSLPELHRLLAIHSWVEQRSPESMKRLRVRTYLSADLCRRHRLWYHGLHCYWHMRVLFCPYPAQ